MKIEQAKQAQEYLMAINEIDRFLNLFNPYTCYICLENGEGKSIFHLTYTNTLEAIEQILKEKKEEYYKIIEDL